MSCGSEARSIALEAEIARLRAIVTEQEVELCNLSTRLARVEGAMRTDAGFAAQLDGHAPISERC